MRKTKYNQYVPETEDRYQFLFKSAKRKKMVNSPFLIALKQKSSQYFEMIEMKK